MGPTVQWMVAVGALGAACSVPTAGRACEPQEVVPWIASSPGIEGAAFPHDATPWVSVFHRSELAARAVILDRDGAEVPLVRDAGVTGAGVRIDLEPVEPLEVGGSYVIRVVDDPGWDDDSLAAVFPPVEFEAGPSRLDTEPEAPTFDLDLWHYPPSPRGRCRPPTDDQHWVQVTLHELPPPTHGSLGFHVGSPADVDAWGGGWFHFVRPFEIVEPELPLWRLWDRDASRPDPACVQAVLTDEYGRASPATDAVCADPAPGCLASTAAPRKASSLFALLPLVALGRRGWRRDHAPGSVT